MRALFICLLALGLAGETSGFFLDTLVDGFNSVVGLGLGILDFGATAVNSVFDTGIKIGGNIIGAVVDPFGDWSGPKEDHGHATGQVVKCPAIADIIFVLDTSGSMSNSEFELEKTFAIRLAEHFKLGKNDVQFGAIVFSDTVTRVASLGELNKYEQLKLILGFTPYLGDGTKTYRALDFIRETEMFSTRNGARAYSSKIVIVITDGNSDSWLSTSNAADKLRNEGVKIIAVGIGSGFGTELYNIASGSSNVFTADTFNQLMRIEQKVARRTCEIPQADGYIPSTGSGGSGGGGSETSSCPKGFTPNPKDATKCVDINECKTDKHNCQQRCTNLVGSFRCGCNDGYAVNPKEPNKCNAVKSCAGIGDIIVVIDASGSIGADNFAFQQDFLNRLVRHFAIGRNGVLFGGIVFATEVQQLFDLNTYTTPGTVGGAFKAAPYLTGGTNTHRALNYIRDNNLFSAEHGGRPAAPDIVIVLTDGKSSREADTKTAASNLKKQGVKILSVGIGNQVDTAELSAIASTPEDTYLVADFDLLDYIEQSLAERTCAQSNSG
jgi:Mg-chelatase subunit ChlD